MLDLKSKAITKYSTSLNKLHNVGNTYLNNASDNDKAKENLFKVYKIYSLIGIIGAYAILFASIIAVLAFHQYGWLILMPLSVAFPLSVQWSIRNVLNISPSEYHEWSKSNKLKK